MPLAIRLKNPYLKSMKKKSGWTFKDKLEITEALCTIIVSVMALWGTISAFQHNLFRKASHLIEHYHQKVIELENEKKL